MAQDFVDGNNDEAGTRVAQPGSPLTARESQVVTLLAEGKGNKEVAWLLNVSAHNREPSEPDHA
jgi:DNA-binding NarL/FixJ family response regulator